MVVLYWIVAVVAGLIGAFQALKYTQTPDRTKLTLGLVFLLACGGLVYLALTTNV